MIWTLVILLFLWLFYKVTKWSMSSPPLPVKQEEPDAWVTLTGSVDIDDDLADGLDGIEIDDTDAFHFDNDGEDVTPEELGITDVKIKFSKDDIDDIDWL